MQNYDPYEAPPPGAWLALDEEARVEAVVAWHRGARVKVANERLHAAIHVVVETQLAMKEAIVIETMTRLQEEGLDRHDAIHAVGGVLVEELLNALKAPSDKTTIAVAYLGRLRALTAQSWLAGAN